MRTKTAVDVAEFSVVKTNVVRIVAHVHREFAWMESVNPAAHPPARHARVVPILFVGFLVANALRGFSATARTSARRLAPTALKTRTVWDASAALILYVGYRAERVHCLILAAVVERKACAGVRRLVQASNAGQIIVVASAGPAVHRQINTVLTTWSCENSTALAIAQMAPATTIILTNRVHVVVQARPVRAYAASVANRAAKVMNAVRV